jgi:hypothetical protein
MDNGTQEGYGHLSLSPPHTAPLTSERGTIVPKGLKVLPPQGGPLARLSCLDPPSHSQGQQALSTLTPSLCRLVLAPSLLH